MKVKKTIHIRRFIEAIRHKKITDLGQKEHFIETVEKYVSAGEPVGVDLETEFVGKSLLVTVKFETMISADKLVRRDYEARR